MSKEVYQENQYYHSLSPSGALQVYTGRCILVSIQINTLANGAIGIIDGTSGTTINVGEIKPNTSEKKFVYNIVMANGIRIIKELPTQDITIIYRV